MGIDVQIMGQRIRAARKSRNMTAEQLAEQIGIAMESLGHIECGVRKPSLQTLYRIAEILDVSLDYLTGRTVSPTESQLQNRFSDTGLNAEQEKLLMDLAMCMLPVIKEMK